MNKVVRRDDVDTTGMEGRNVDMAPLSGYAEGSDYYVTGPHDNGLEGARKRSFLEYCCNQCVFSHPYPRRMKEHLDAGVHLYRNRNDVPQTLTAGPAVKDVEVNG